jgi:hypothetical protein
MHAGAESPADQERQDQLAELTAEYGPDWEAQYRPGSFGCHELLDRVNLLGNLVEEQVLGHPACALRAEWHQLATQAVEALRVLYQQVAESHLDEGGPADPADTLHRRDLAASPDV